MPTSGSRLLGVLARIAFLAAVAGFAWWGLRDSWGDVRAALADLAWWRPVPALLLVLGGLALTGLLWLRILAASGHHVPTRAALGVFFVGQLGKYLPGSVWSFGAQAALARRFDVPVRTTVSTSLSFLGLHLTTGALAGGLAAWVVDPDTAVPRAGWLVVASVGLVGLVPVVLRWGTRLVAGGEVSLAWGWPESIVATGLMAWVWGLYVAALVVLLPDAVHARAWGVLLAAFALGYVAGVAVPLAPAGVGVREVVFVALASPLLGLGGAVALSLLARVVHTVADGLIALVTGWERGGHGLDDQEFSHR